MSASKIDSPMNQSYIKPDNECQEEILSKGIKAESWGELAAAVRERARRWLNVADAFERYEREGQPFPGEKQDDESSVAA